MSEKHARFPCEPSALTLSSSYVVSVGRVVSPMKLVIARAETFSMGTTASAVPPTTLVPSVLTLMGSRGDHTPLER